MSRWIADAVDVLVYLVVLNLAVAFTPWVISESFLMTLFTAVLLKLVLEVVVLGKNAVKARVKAARTPIGKFGSALLLFVVLAGSKFVVIELTYLLFNGTVSLGGFWSVTGLILVLMAARAGVRWILNRVAG